MPVTRFGNWKNQYLRIARVGNVKTDTADTRRCSKYAGQREWRYKLSRGGNQAGTGFLRAASGRTDVVCWRGGLATSEMICMARDR